ncbi:hypothetical protein DO72_5434 [Burkholderia pseudomallei]|nr:hypothetical protein DO72_5434 [Burkholderia pseudomallei]KGR93529.1 hypothetical protein X948_5537 [Burkholderia pseudomallei MSHR5608]
MSSGPFARKLKPRAGSSTCGEDTPRSSSTPDTRPTPRASSAPFIAAKLSWTISNRASSMLSAVSIARGSLSNAISRPASPRRASTARLWPPRPNVPSTYTPSGRVTSASTASSNSTVRCWNSFPIAGVFLTAIRT